MFGHAKYDACHVALERSGADVDELCRLGIELQRALGQFEASLKSFLFNESSIGWDADKLRNPKRWVCRRSCPLGREGRGSVHTVAMFCPREREKSVATFHRSPCGHALGFLTLIDRLTSLPRPPRHTGGAELVAQFESMQQNEAAALCRFTAAASDQAYASVKGSTAGKALPKLSVDAPHLATDVQPLPAIFQGMVSHPNTMLPTAP